MMSQNWTMQFDREVADNESILSDGLACRVKRRRKSLTSILVFVNVTTLIMNLNSNNHNHRFAVQAFALSANQSTAEQRQTQTQTQKVPNERQQHGDQSYPSANQTFQPLASTNNARQSHLNPSQQSEVNALSYLQRYGYMSPQVSISGLPPTSNQLVSEESFSEAVKSFQKFAGIAESGLVDEQTLKFMRMSRCGNTDKSQQVVTGRRQQLISPQEDSNGLHKSQSNRMGPRTRAAIESATSRGLKRRRRYALQGSKWRRQELTYRISQYPTRFHGKRQEVDAQIEKAFGIWSQVAPINFVPKREGRVHIDIRFASGDHGDGDAFDGPGNTLAHAYFPQYGGDAHFDDQEYWTIDSYTGTNIFQVAAHELGHSLGLGHSNVREALMAPFYQKYKPNFRLHVDDILAIQSLYGEKPFLIPEAPSSSSGSGSTTTSQSTTSSTTTTTSTSTSTTTTSTSTIAPASSTEEQSFTARKPARFWPDSRSDLPDPDNDNNIPDSGLGGTSGGNTGGDSFNGSGGQNGQIPVTPVGGTDAQPADLCSDSIIDAITRTEDGSSYVFKGDYYWLLTSEGLAHGYPKKISLDWDGLPGNLDAALTWTDGKTFFFKGNKYWRFRNKRRDIGYPKLISVGFAGIPDNIDAAFVWSGNGRTYIFKGAEYWRFDSKSDPPVSAEYPRSIKFWNGVPAYINAAFKWENNVTYFFKGNQYYRFNDREFRIEARGRPQFPRNTAEWWFGCSNTNQAQRALSSSLREIGEHSLINQHERAYIDRQKERNPNSAMSQDDWSLLSGLADHTTRMMGTHVNDHRSPSSGSAGQPDELHNPLESSGNPREHNSDTETNSGDDIDESLGPRTGTNQRNQVTQFGRRSLGPQSRVSSSAISSQGNILLLLIGSLLMTILTSSRIGLAFEMSQMFDKKDRSIRRYFCASATH